MNAPRPAAEMIAPIPFQAEVLANQIAADLDRRYWRERAKLISDFAERKRTIEQDRLNLSGAAFLAKHSDWDFSA